MPSRRDVLALYAGSLAAVAGCGGRTETETTPQTDREPTTDPPTSAQTPTATPAPSTGVTVDGAARTWERVLEPTLRAGPVHVGGTVVAVARDSGEEPLSADPAVGSGAAYLATSGGAMVRVDA